MDVAIAGGHGQIARRLARLLVERGDTVFGLIRKREHVEDLRADGTEPVLIDLEAAGPEEIAEAIRGADARGLRRRRRAWQRRRAEADRGPRRRDQAARGRPVSPGCSAT